MQDAIDLRQLVEVTLKGKIFDNCLGWSSFAPSQAEQLPKLPPLFLLTPLFFCYHPCPSILASRIHTFKFYKLHSALSLSRILVEFSLKLSYSTIYGKNFQIYGVHISRKCIDSSHFYSCPSSLKTHSQVLVIMPYAEGNYSLPQIAFFRKSVSPNSGKGRRKL